VSPDPTFDCYELPKPYEQKPALRSSPSASLAVAQTAPRIFSPFGWKSDSRSSPEFTVKAEPNRGYAASETLTGSRVKTSNRGPTRHGQRPHERVLRGTSASSNFRKQTSSNSAVSRASTSAAASTSADSSSSSQLRDGFFRLGRYGSSNVDRVEIVEGSNAAIYGAPPSPARHVEHRFRAAPGTGKPAPQSSTANEGTQRGTLEATGPLARTAFGKTNYVFTASHFQKEFDMEMPATATKSIISRSKTTFPTGSACSCRPNTFSRSAHLQQLCSADY